MPFSGKTTWPITKCNTAIDDIFDASIFGSMSPGISV